MKVIPDGLLEEITRRLVDEFQPEEIILFGSHAWGTPDEDSDIDLYVVVAESDEPEVTLDARAYLRLSGVRGPKDILVRTRHQYERYQHIRPSLEWRVASQGRRLYGSGARRASP
jgi:predicted nucleotidyltransferase